MWRAPKNKGREEVKFYVAGKFEDRARIKGLMKTITALGHEITTDWTTHEIDSEDKLHEYALEDVSGVRDCDYYVGVFIDNSYRYSGALVELGVALGLDKGIVIIGHAIDSCIFIKLPFVGRFETIDEFVECLKEDLTT